MTAPKTEALRLTAVFLRVGVTLGLLLATTRLLLGTAGIPLLQGLWLWLGLTGALGLVVARRWALLLPLVLVPATIWYELYTGAARFLGEDWQYFIPIELLLGLAGSAVGSGARWGMDRVAEKVVLAGHQIRDWLSIAVTLVFLLIVVLSPQYVWSTFLDPAAIARLGPPPPVAAAALKADAATVSYPVYAASTDEGAPANAFRSVSSPYGVVLSDIYYVDYHGADRHGRDDVQVMSSLAELAPTAGRAGADGAMAKRPEVFEFGGAVWEVQPAPPDRFYAGTVLGDAYVAISAPNRAVFERLVAGLRRLN